MGDGDLKKKKKEEAIIKIYILRWMYFEMENEVSISRKMDLLNKTMREREDLITLSRISFIALRKTSKISFLTLGLRLQKQRFHIHIFHKGKVSCRACIKGTETHYKSVSKRVVKLAFNRCLRSCDLACSFSKSSSVLTSWTSTNSRFT